MAKATSHNYPTILVALPDTDTALAAVGILSRLPRPVRFVVGSQAALRRAMMNQQPDMVLAHLDIVGQGQASIMALCRARGWSTAVVVATPPGRDRDAAIAVMDGALATLRLPLQSSALQAVLSRAAALRALTDAAQQAPAAPISFSAATARRQAADLRRFESALDALYMVWQPVFGAQSLGPIGYEALLRTEDPRVPTPRELLDLAAQVGRSQQLDQRILEAVAEDIAAGGLDGTLFVNIDLPQLRQGTLGSVTDPLRASAQRLVLDLQSDGRVDHPVDLAAQAERLRAAGYRIALDDIGSCGDILPRLVALHPDILKIDRLAIAGCDADPRKARFIREIVNLAHDDGALVLAEGVEQLGELSTARLLGCDLLQGFVLGRPAIREHWIGVRSAVRSLRAATSA